MIFVRTLLTTGLIWFMSGLISNQVIADDKFRVCADPNNPPYSDKNGGGFENQIAKMFAVQLGQKLEYTWFPQRMGFIRNTLKAKLENEDRYKCDYVIGVPAGYDLTLTTKPYYHSQYQLVIAMGRAWDDIKTADDLANINSDRKQKLRIAMFDRGPGTTWLLNNGLIKNGVPYQTMSGDATTNVTLTMEHDLLKGVIDMAIIWGPVAGYLLTHNRPNSFKLLPMHSQPGLKFDFPISMGVRYGDNKRRDELNRLIDKNATKIIALLEKYNIPLMRK